MSLARLCLWAGLQPAWLYLAAPCCAVLAPRKAWEGNNTTANPSHPQPGSTCKTNPPAATQSESNGQAWHQRHSLLAFKLTPHRSKRCCQAIKKKCSDAVAIHWTRCADTGVQNTSPNYRLYCMFVTVSCVMSVVQLTRVIVMCTEIPYLARYHKKKKKSTLTKLLESDRLPKSDTFLLSVNQFRNS